eukprot:5940372-Prymnesium_polylepis.1
MPRCEQARGVGVPHAKRPRARALESLRTYSHAGRDPLPTDRRAPVEARARVIPPVAAAPIGRGAAAYVEPVELVLVGALARPERLDHVDLGQVVLAVHVGPVLPARVEAVHVVAVLVAPRQHKRLAEDVARAVCTRRRDAGTTRRSMRLRACSTRA